MFQTFNTDTLISRFIKNLLATTRIPNISCVHDGDYVLKNCTYMYKHVVIRCDCSGILNDECLVTSDLRDGSPGNGYSDAESLFAALEEFKNSSPAAGTLFDNGSMYTLTGTVTRRSQLSTSIHVRGTKDLTILCSALPVIDETAVGKIITLTGPIEYNGQSSTYQYKAGSTMLNAKVHVVCYTDDESSMEPYTYVYRSPTRWYDAETHRQLGNYLRYVQHTQQLNLMPFYNCYSSFELSDTIISSEGVIQNTPTTSRVIAVPIRFNKQYTVAIDAPTGAELACAIVTPSGVVVNPRTSARSTINFNDSYRHYSSISFHDPVLFSYMLDSTGESPEHDSFKYQYNKDLYLLIQVAQTNTSTVVVLEGDYTNLNCLHTTEDTHVRTYSLQPALSLLRVSSGESYAFADRLVEYLLNNVITSQDISSSNIARIQEALVQLDETYRTQFASRRSSSGVWDDFMTEAILRLIDTHRDEFSLEDQDGNVNKDVEDLMVRLGSYR